MLYNIEFKHIEIYYATETIEANSEEEAEAIARKLLDHPDFEERLMDSATYDDHEDSFIQTYKVEPSKWVRETLTEREIKSYTEE